jgi:DNA-binding NarL/FixJ family response regulator
MLLDNLLDTILKQNPDAPITWKELGALVRMQQDSIIKVQTPTPRQLSEREVLFIQRICEGKETRDIADEFHISPRTLETLRISIKKKTGAKNIAQIVMYAVKAGIVAVE